MATTTKMMFLWEEGFAMGTKIQEENIEQKNRRMSNIERVFTSIFDIEYWAFDIEMKYLRRFYVR